MYRKILECDIEMKTGCFRFYESVFEFILDHQIMKTKHYTNYAVMKLETPFEIEYSTFYQCQNSNYFNYMIVK